MPDKTDRGKWGSLSCDNCNHVIIVIIIFLNFHVNMATNLGVIDRNML